MTDTNEYLKSYFSINQPYNVDENRYSSLIIALKDARLITNRNVETGLVTLKIQAPLTPANWGGAITYLIILELIGTCFKPKSKTTSGDNAIYKALINFSSLSESEARAIESLRHSFAHNYGLINISKNKKGTIVNSRTHHFLFTSDLTNESVVKEREEFWDGEFDTRNIQNRTLINIWGLGDLVESIFKKLVVENSSNNIDLLLQHGIDELQAKYSIII